MSSNTKQSSSSSFASHDTVGIYHLPIRDDMADILCVGPKQLTSRLNKYRPVRSYSDSRLVQCLPTQSFDDLPLFRRLINMQSISEGTGYSSSGSGSMLSPTSSIAMSDDDMDDIERPKCMPCLNNDGQGSESRNN